MSRSSQRFVGKNILVTGGAGFIGSHLVETLVGEHCNVIVADLEIKHGSYFKSQKLDKKVRFIKCDVRDYRQICDVIKKNKIDYVFHLAAQAIVTSAYDNPVETFEINIMGTVNVLEAVRLSGKVKGLVVASSDKAYGKVSRASEDNPIGGNHPYESSKASADLIAQTYFKTYGLPVVVTRFGNVYGEGDLNFSRIIPGIMFSVVNNKELKLRSDGKFVRDYVYVGDVIDACILLAENINKFKGEFFNISSRENVSVVGLIDIVSKILKIEVRYRILNNEVNEIPVQSVDFSKIRKGLGWKPKNSLKTTVVPIFQWYKNFFQKV